MHEYNPGKVPIMRPVEPLQVPEAPGAADIIMKTAELKQRDREMQFKANQALADSLATATELYMKKKEQDLERYKVEALIELQRAAGSSQIVQREAEIKKLNAETNKANAQASMLQGQGEIKPQVVEFEGKKFLKTAGPQGPRYTSIPSQRGQAEAVHSVADAIQSFGKIDEYFNAVEGSGKTELARRFSQSNLPGAALFNPKVAQAETALLTLFQFANGGKALTDNETKLITGMARNSAFGAKERAKARQDMKDLLSRRIKATLAANLTGEARSYLEAELAKASAGYTSGDIVTRRMKDGSMKRLRVLGGGKFEEVE